MEYRDSFGKTKLENDKKKRPNKKDAKRPLGRQERCVHCHQIFSEVKGSLILNDQTETYLSCRMTIGWDRVATLLT